MALIAMIGTFVNGYNTRRANRDKLEFDAELIQLKAELNDCRGQHKASEDDRNNLRTDLDRAKMVQAELSRQVDDLRREIDVLRKST